MSAYRRALREAKKRKHSIDGRPLPEFYPAAFIYKFCPRCKKRRNMMLWGTGPQHETARCVHCRCEWVFVSPYSDPYKQWKIEEGVLVGQIVRHHGKSLTER